MNVCRLKVGARTSPLSQAQVQEVLEELQGYYPQITFDPQFVVSTGDKDLTTSLRTLDKTDFFTKEIDQMVLKGECDLAIHSAKDLPDPLPEGLALAALTRGVDPADVLVMRPGETLDSLPSGAIIATSSERREQAVQRMRPDLAFTDIRGTIAQRLSRLDDGSADGVVVAEAALIRLGLTSLNRIRIPGETAAHQGQLAIVVRSDNAFLMNLFRCLGSCALVKRTILFLGINSPHQEDGRLIHYPIIRIEPRPLKEAEVQRAFRELPCFTHLLFTSQSAVSIFFDYLMQSNIGLEGLRGKQIAAVGKATAKRLKEYGMEVHLCAPEESSEGLIEAFEKMDLTQAYLLWPHSALSRSILNQYFAKRNVRFFAPVFYDTHPNLHHPLPNLAKVDEIVFTSPSCVDAFRQIFGSIPKDITATCIGPVTETYLLANNK